VAEEEIIDAESGTLNKETSPLDHLRHLLKIGWEPERPLIRNFVEKYGLEEDLQQFIRERKSTSS
jgi:hypothetical protein